MRRSSSADAAKRAYLGASRATITKVADGKKMQEIDVDITSDESRQGVERPQNYGFTSNPLPPSANGDAAEAIMVGMGGSRSHPVVVAIDDRRHRLKDIKSGESAQYDDQGQKVHLTRDGIVMETPKKFTLNVNGKGSITIDKDGVITLKGSAIKFEKT
jgi:phage baseplate assembly protein V